MYWRTFLRWLNGSAQANRDAQIVSILRNYHVS